ncbi:peptide/nickel transport system permease protein [Thermocatellispora tengchongensis]|uniref:Peptide/nickel transport system permease protein n=1 Tax=Thermocatellispora tengchongensis TaxID=1073253 RepID=A0A840PEM7_9ACTN|nr:ABC transporter permease [Thermocatellispora tengchongensis]MBB5135910.1 peptide/nickel transport system permease protein [Thermocatellispora tengchongensis]
MSQADQISLPAESGGAAPGQPAAPAPVAARRGGDTLYFALRNKKLVGGLIVVLALLVLGVVGPLVHTNSPTEYLGTPGQSPGGEWLMGTTMFGQDVLAQFLHGLRSTFLVGALGGGLAAIVGMAVGFVAGYRGGLVDEVLNMLTNILLVIPTLAVLIIIAAYLKVRGVMVEALFIGFTSWPWAARAVRSQTLTLASRDFVDLARLSGVPTWKIITRDIAPNMSSYLFMTFILLFGGAVLAAATLDFIGLGPTDGMSLGLMLNNAVRWSALQLGLWWWFVPPGLGITAVVGALYVMNVGLDEVFNPRLREM